MNKQNFTPGQWLEFEVFPGLKATALIKSGKVEAVKLITKVPRRFYYSFLNDAGFEADKLFSHGKN